MFDDTMLQEFNVYGFQYTRLSAFQRKYKLPNWKGVWVYIGTVQATNPWAACREAQKLKRGPYYWRLKAIPTWRKVNRKDLVQ